MLLRLLRGSAAALMLVSVPPDAADTVDRGKPPAIEVSAGPAAPGLAPLLPLIEIRSPLGEREAFVAGERVDLGHKEVALLALVLEAREGTPYDKIDRTVWPGERVDLSRRRRTLVHRLNESLEERVDAALARVGKRRSEKLIRCGQGRVYLTVWACTRVSAII